MKSLTISPTQLETETIPNSPGIYRFYDAKGTLLYVGRALHISNRLLAHFDSCNLKLARLAARLAQNETHYFDCSRISQQVEKDLRSLLIMWSCRRVIDLALCRVKTIQIDFMSHEDAIGQEDDLIFQLEPLFNYETASAEYYTLRNMMFKLEEQLTNLKLERDEYITQITLISWDEETPRPHAQKLPQQLHVPTEARESINEPSHAATTESFSDIPRIPWEEKTKRRCTTLRRARRKQATGISLRPRNMRVVRVIVSREEFDLAHVNLSRVLSVLRQKQGDLQLEVP